MIAQQLPLFDGIQAHVAPGQTAHYDRDEATGSDDWYTPAYILDAARRAMGGIDLDPASCDAANQTVQATHIYTVEDSGLAHDWFGRVWLNPPYSNKLPWITHLDRQYQVGNVEQAILLVPSSTETAFFQPLFGRTLCFPVGRIQFVSGDPSKNGNTKGSVLAFWGADDTAFRAAFGPLGRVGRFT